MPSLARDIATLYSADSPVGKKVALHGRGVLHVGLKVAPHRHMVQYRTQSLKLMTVERYRSVISTMIASNRYR